jgi:hypothetical protein
MNLALFKQILGPVVAAAVGAGAALAAGTKGSATLEAKVDQLVKDMGAVKCKLNIENTCPK